jgi:hypothetical protein
VPVEPDGDKTSSKAIKLERGNNNRFYDGLAIFVPLIELVRFYPVSSWEIKKKKIWRF